MEAVYIVSAVRTPIGKFGGSLMDFSSADMGTIAAKAALERASVKPEQVELGIFGNGRQAGGGPNVARQITYRAGVPETAPAYTVNQACASGLAAVAQGYQEIVLGHADCVLAGGTESMSRLPYLLENARWGYRLGNQVVTDAMYKDGFQDPLSNMLMGETAEKLGALKGITREEQDEYALCSQNRAENATKNGWFKNEIVPIEIKEKKATRMYDLDEHVRMGATIESMKKLPPVFSKTGTVTAGNSSGITDGAAATVLASERKVKEWGLKPMAKIVGYTSVGVDPSIMGIGPVPAVRKLLQQINWKLEDFALIELNEAFAAQVLACDLELKFDRSKLNVHGGAISLGHPIGCSGARVLTTLLHGLKQHGGERGLATLCVSGGMGVAMAVERV